MGLNLDADENCNFVRQNLFCNFNTKLINYLEFAVCTMRIDNYPWYGEIGYIICSILLLLFLVFTFFIMTRWL